MSLKQLHIIVIDFYSGLEIFELDLQSSDTTKFASFFIGQSKETVVPPTTRI